MKIDVSALQIAPIEITLRLICAMLIGVLIGTEREFTHRPAGMRTHMLVCLGAAVVMITSQLLFAQYAVYGATPDPARLGAQVITGIGFLGAGTIIKEGATIKGLTTAASIWATACLGLAVGAGYYLVCLIGSICVFVTLSLFELLQKKLVKSYAAPYTFTVTCRDVVSTLSLINRSATEQDAEASKIQVLRHGDENFDIVFRIDFNGRRSDERLHAFLSSVGGDAAVDYVSEERIRI